MTPWFANLIGVSAGLAPFNTSTITFAVSTPIWYWSTPKPKTPMDDLSRRIKVVEDDIGNIPPGYYVILGVYNSPGGAYKITNEIRQKLDLEVASFLHPNNNFTYIYVDKPYERKFIQTVRGIGFIFK